jgi:hypothetical protein
MCNAVQVEGHIVLAVSWRHSDWRKLGFKPPDGSINFRRPFVIKVTVVSSKVVLIGNESIKRCKVRSIL